MLEDLLIEFPHRSAVADFLAIYEASLREALKKQGHPEEAEKIAQQTRLRELAAGLTDPVKQISLSWRLCVTKLRNPELAIELARKAILAQSENGTAWSVLGAAQYRAGDYPAALESLEQSKKLIGGLHYNDLLVALVQGRKGDKDAALHSLDQAFAWMAAHPPTSDPKTYYDRINQLLRECVQVLGTPPAGDGQRGFLEGMHPAILNNIAWNFATKSDPKRRYGDYAVQLAAKAVERAPTEGLFWNTLGAARFRSGDWKEARTALEKSMALRHGGDSFDWFFLAMTLWQVGNKEEARAWYEKACQWRLDHKPFDEELTKFRTEAADLLHIAHKPTTDEPRPPQKGSATPPGT
jgi:tetratricopeptide (TPR) repeat protein